MESWQRLPAAAGRVEKMISNPEKCRPDGGPGARAGGGEDSCLDGEPRGKADGVYQQASGRGQVLSFPLFLLHQYLLRVYYVPRQRASPSGYTAGC